MLFQNSEMVYIYFHFKANQDFIAEFLCINKDKPELGCHGCCQLKKQMKESSDRQQEQQKIIFVRKTAVVHPNNPG